MGNNLKTNVRQSVRNGMTIMSETCHFQPKNLSLPCARTLSVPPCLLPSTLTHGHIHTQTHPWKIPAALQPHFPNAQLTSHKKPGDPRFPQHPGATFQLFTLISIPREARLDFFKSTQIYSPNNKGDCWYFFCCCCCSSYLIAWML